MNLDKTIIVIFRNGGFIARREEWFYTGQKMYVVGAYAYLGIFLTTKLSFTNIPGENGWQGKNMSASMRDYA